VAFPLLFIRSRLPLKFLFLVFGCVLSLNWASLADAARLRTIRTRAASVGTLNDTLLCTVANAHKTKTVSVTVYLDGNDILLPPTSLAPGDSLSFTMSGTPVGGRRRYCEAQIWGSPRWVDGTLKVQHHGMTVLILGRVVVK